MIAYFTGAIGIIAACTIVWLVRRDRLHVNHGISWIVIAVLFAFLGVAPKTIDFISLHLGIGYPPTLALTLGIVLLTLKILLMDIERSRLEMRIQRMTQRLAMLEAELEKKASAVADKTQADKPAKSTQRALQ